MPTVFTAVFKPSSSIEASTAMLTVEEAAIIRPARIGSKSIPGTTMLPVVMFKAVAPVEIKLKPVLVALVAWHFVRSYFRPMRAIIVAGYWFE